MLHSLVVPCVARFVRRRGRVWGGEGRGGETRKGGRDGDGERGGEDTKRVGEKKWMD